MNVFFASCITAKSKNQSRRLAAIREILQRSGHTVYEYIYDLDMRDNTRDFGELMQRITNCDVYIAEMSQPSQTLGFQLAYALNNVKPCLYLYDTDTQGSPDFPLMNHPSRLFRINAYDADSIESQVQKFVAYAQKQMISRRTSFMSTIEIDNFIDLQAHSRGVHKAELIREILHAAASRKI